MALKSWGIAEIPPESVRAAHAIQCSEDMTSAYLIKNKGVLHFATNINSGKSLRGSSSKKVSPLAWTGAQFPATFPSMQ